MRLALRLGALLLLSTASEGWGAQAFCPNCDRQEEQSPSPELRLAREVHQTLEPILCDSAENWERSTIQRKYQEFQTQFPDQKTDSVNGLTLKGNSYEWEALRIALGKKPPASSLKAARICSTVLCALSQLFSKDETTAKQVVLTYVATGYAFSQDQTDQPHGSEFLFPPHEIRAVSQALEKLPPELLRLNGMRDFRRLKNQYRLRNHAETTTAFAQGATYSMGTGKITRPGYILFYDRGIDPTFDWGRPSSHVLFETLTHELCHHLDYQNLYLRGVQSSASPDFLTLGEWQERESSDRSVSYVSSQAQGFFSDYAQTSPEEDFAESCSAYLHSPAELKARSPTRYAYFKERVFHQKEFLDRSLLLPKEWPALTLLLSSPDFCTPLLQTCGQEISVALHSETNQPMYSETALGGYYYGPFQHFLDQGGKCYLREKTALEKKLLQNLEAEKDFCERGGKLRIGEETQTLCQTELLERLHRAPTPHPLSTKNSP